MIIPGIGYRIFFCINVRRETIARKGGKREYFSADMRRWLNTCERSLPVHPNLAPPSSKALRKRCRMPGARTAGRHGRHGDETRRLPERRRHEIQSPGRLRRRVERHFGDQDFDQHMRSSLSTGERTKVKSWKRLDKAMQMHFKGINLPIRPFVAICESRRG